MQSRNPDPTPDGSLWYPFTQMQNLRAEDLLYVVRGEGNYLVDESNRNYFDAISSMWVNLLGHSRPEITQAIRGQLTLLPHTSLFGQTHAPALELARRLAGIAPQGLNHVFFSDDGSTAVEAALKMAFQYWQQSADAQPRRRLFVTLQHGYHGDTLGAVSVGDIEHFHHLYRPLLFETLRVPSPYCYRCALGKTPKDCEMDCVHSLERLLAERAQEVVAVVLEPRVQAAAGMIVHPRGWLGRVAETCRRHDVLLIADEVAVGFGRTGKMFACQTENVTPDIMCLGKGLTGGYLPLAATLTTDRIYQAFLAPYDQQKTFFHGHSYTGNPLAASAALATLDVLKNDSVLEKMQPRIEQLSHRLQDVRTLPHVGDVRQCGFIVGIELVRDRESREPFTWADHVGLAVSQHARLRQVILRPLGHVVYYFLPLTTTAEEIDRLVDVTVESITLATQGR